MTASKLVVIGNGGAAIHAVHAARSAGHSGPIHQVSDKPGRVFNPMLSPYYLAGKIAFEDCFPFGEGIYKEYGITCHFGSPVDVLDTTNREVVIAGGEKLVYDQCLVATGASPLFPSASGLRSSRHAFTLRTAEETILLHEAMTKAKSVLILGASLVGIKLAEIFIQGGLKVTLVDIADQILPHSAHAECASLLHTHLTDKGVEIHLGWTLEWIEDHEKEAYCHFQGGETLKADLCLVCIGIRPNLDFLEGSDVDMDQGILVDHRMRTNLEDLYAAGDVSQGRNLLTGKKEVIGLWGNACYQGRTAGLNLAGQRASYPGAIPDHIATFFGLTFIHLGNPNPQGNDMTVLSNRDFPKDPYRLMVFDRGMLVGANLINGFENAGRLKMAMIRKLNWNEYFGPLKNLPSDQEIERFLTDITS